MSKSVIILLNSQQKILVNVLPSSNFTRNAVARNVIMFYLLHFQDLRFWQTNVRNIRWWNSQWDFCQKVLGLSWQMGMSIITTKCLVIISATYTLVLMSNFIRKKYCFAWLRFKWFFFIFQQDNNTRQGENTWTCTYA